LRLIDAQADAAPFEQMAFAGHQVFNRGDAAAGIRRVGRFEKEREGLPACGGEVIEPRVVVWCTGFAPDYRWIGLPVLGDDGYPRHRRGVATDAPGLYFLGLRFQHRVTSSLIGGVGEDAAFIAEQVARRCEALALA